MQPLTEQELTTLERLRHRCERYAKLLKLSDWTILVNFRDHKDIEYSYAKTRINANAMQAEIFMQRPGDYAKSELAEGKPFLTLLHELMHIRLWGIETAKGELEPTAQICHEQAIEALAEAVLKLEAPKYTLLREDEEHGNLYIKNTAPTKDFSYLFHPVGNPVMTYAKD